MVIDVALFTVKHGAPGDPPHGVAVMTTLPTETNVVVKLDPDSKPVPVTPTTLVPFGWPSCGERAVTVGTGAYVYVSAEDVWLTPKDVVTVMSTVAALCDGMSSTEICVALVTLKHGLTGDPGHGVALMSSPPIVTSVAPLKPDPPTVTVLPPPRAPADGKTLVTTGVGSYTYWSAGEVALVPPEFSTVTSTVPAACAGMFGMVIDVALLIVKQSDPGH
jgi:hypothetical protein